MKNEYHIDGDVIKIFVKLRDDVFVTIVDRDSFDVVNSFRGSWYAFKNRHNLYVAMCLREKGKNVYHYLHRVVNDCPPDLVVDHINGNTFDNRKSNLRNVTVGENTKNRNGPNRDNKSTGVLGVYYRKEIDKFRAIIGYGDRLIHLGHFPTINEAIAARKEAERIYQPFSKRIRNRGYVKQVSSKSQGG
ncbi:HNH endonuclease [Paenibacillus sp. ACRRX]|uniref:HNH endonuclease n=1 Tax=Paenibacillus sp. ACRRX TaxID=2918206 RepID=UPI001EF42946|nr:HNH endonuclease [Paenibacillus sp. ACRRX]MCG7407717.1 HNH endonuclease [Paenibacillus sp. ACRRX]